MMACCGLLGSKVSIECAVRASPTHSSRPLWVFNVLPEIPGMKINGSTGVGVGVGLGGGGGGGVGVGVAVGVGVGVGVGVAPTCKVTVAFEHAPRSSQILYVNVSVPMNPNSGL